MISKQAISILFMSSMLFLALRGVVSRTLALLRQFAVGGYRIGLVVSDGSAARLM